MLINLGTPDAPTARDVRRYLREFLSDPRVIDMPAPLRWLLLNLIILPFRPRASAHAYQAIWTAEGSPLLLNARALERDVAASLGDGYRVVTAMRYGRPSIAEALQTLRDADVARVIVLPLFPQYASATTGSALQRLFEELGASKTIVPISIVDAFYEHPEFIAAWAAVAQPALDAFGADYVLLSYHGLPERHVLQSDGPQVECDRVQPCPRVAADNRYCYRAQCYATSRALADALGLRDDTYGVAFQSRLGRTQWIRPYTDTTLPELAARGVKRLAVMSPAFTADCLETLEELGIRGREQWLELGGEDFLLVPSLNAHPRWVQAVGRLLSA